MFDGVFFLLKVMAVMLLFTIPLGLWKLFDIVMWMINHVEVGIN